MEINAHVEFAADPARTFEMLTDPSFLEQVALESEGTNIEVSVEGNTTTSRRDLPAPDVAKKLTGDTLRIEETVEWGEADADGTRSGTVTVTVKGQPAKMNGTVKMTPGGPGTVGDVSGELKVNIPLMGKKIEKMAAPLIIEGVETWESVGKKRLA